MSNYVLLTAAAKFFPQPPALKGLESPIWTFLTDEIWGNVFGFLDILGVIGPSACSTKPHAFGIQMGQFVQDLGGKTMGMM